MKKLSFLVLLSIILFSANTMIAQDNMKAKQADNAASVVITPETFQEYAATNVGKQVEVKGMVVHVCKHGGKKMFIIGEDPEKRVKITASDKVNVFEPELEGSTVMVQGIIDPIEEEEVPEAEKTAEDSDHKNYYHVPQYAISCQVVRTLDE